MTTCYNKFMKAFLPLVIFLVGCRFNPIAEETENWHKQARNEVEQIRQVVKPGDVIFRLSSVPLLGGLVDFSQEVRKATRSDFSHAVLIYRVEPSGVLLADVTASGVTRRYLIDWYMDPSKNVVIKRLKPEYQHLIPLVLSEIEKVIQKDWPYDDKFVPDDERFYCTELVDYCFREIGYPLANRVKIKDFPESKIFVSVGCILSGIDINNEVTIAGNDEFGLFSSPMLETILDLR